MVLMFSLVLLIRASGEMETEHMMSAVPTILVLRNWFMEDNFYTGRGDASNEEWP